MTATDKLEENEEYWPVFVLNLEKKGGRTKKTEATEVNIFYFKLYGLSLFHSEVLVSRLVEFPAPRVR